MKLLKKIGISLALCACTAPLYAADSASNRDSQFIRFGTKAVAIHGLYLLSQPLEVEFPGKDFTIGFAGGSRTTKTVKSTTYNSSTGKWEYTYYDWAGSTLEFNIRSYPGNSFNWLLGYGKYKLELKDWPSLNSTTYDIAYETTQVNFGLGNEWTFDFGMYIGADWLMTGIGLLSNSYTATLVSGTETTASKAYVEKDTRISGVGGAAIFRIGFGF
jgi:hypothetical protein